jgi:hypothetical protein
MKTKYVLITYNSEQKRIDNYYHFESEHDDLDENPYSDKCPVVVGSNQIIVKEGDMEKLTREDLSYIFHK